MTPPGLFYSHKLTESAVLPHRRLLLLSAGLAVLAGLFCATADAYVLEGPKWPVGSTVTFQMALGDAGRTLIDGNTSWDAAAAPAAGIWNQSIHLNLVASTNPSAPISQGDHINTVAFAASAFGYTFGSNTLAMTFYSWGSGNVMTEADIIFNNKQNWDSYRGALRFGTNGYAIGEIRRVLLHEMGHAIGLTHPDQNGQQVSAVMNSVISSVETTTTDDIAGGQSLYGAAASPTPTPTPSPSPTATPTPTPSPTPSPTPTPSPSPTPTPTPSPSPSASPTASPTISLSVSPTTVSAASKGTAIFTVTTSKVNPTASITVGYSMSGTALLGRHYTLSGTSGKVIIPAGATAATVTLTATQTGRTRTATMTLKSGIGYTLSSTKTATVTINP